MRVTPNFAIPSYKEDKMALASAPGTCVSAASCNILLSRDTPWMKLMASMALVSWFLPLVLSMLVVFAPQAQAQATVQTVVVLDFAVAGGLDPLLGRKAADGLAVELQRSGDFEVVTRQRVEGAVGSQAGLQPPFNDTAQVRLAQAVGARSVFSGRVVSVEIASGRSARVRLEIKQLDANSGDFINGTQILESTEQKLQDVANEILVDEAINKAVFSGVRSMKQTTLPEGSVLNTTKDDVEISIGTRSGVSIGQRYSVLRDVFNKAKGVTERVKIGEVRITRTEADQAVAVVSAGGGAGVRTSDRVRQIFESVNYSSTPINSTTSITPVTAPPVRSGEGGGIIKKGGKGILGLVGLAALIGLAGFGGSSSSGSSAAITATTAYNNSGLPENRVTFNSRTTGDFLGINRITRLNEQAVVAYIVARGTAPDFLITPRTVQGVVDATFFAPGQTLNFIDPLEPVSPDDTDEGIGRVVTISTSGGSGNNNNNNGGNNNNNNNNNNSGGGGNEQVTVLSEPGDPNQDFFGPGSGTGGGGGGGGGNNNNNGGSTGYTIQYTQKPLVIGQTYYYRVVPITAIRSVSQGGGNNNNGGGNNNNNNNGGGGGGGGTSGGTSVTITPTIGRTSDSSPGLTPLLRPDIVDETPDGRPFNTDNFSVKLRPDLTRISQDVRYDIRNATLLTGVSAFRVEVSTSNAFPANATFVRELQPPLPDGVGQIILNLGDILVPNYTAASPQLSVRVTSISVSDAPSGGSARDTLTQDNPLGADSVSRFMAAPKAGFGGGVNLPGAGGGRGASSPGIGIPKILRPGR